jgi:hypothetical protein
MITLEVMNFDKVDDPVKTEETLYHQLTEYAPFINTDYVYVALPLAWIINTYGLPTAQHIIDEVHDRGADPSDHSKLFFICQHILVKDLDFKGSTVFTPHATSNDDYISIPHYSCNYDLEMSKPWDDREFDYSFMGDFGSHPTRGRLASLFKDHPQSIFINTSTWHFHTSKETQKLNKKKYIELLGNTRHSLCPRGTGPSTIRMWEAMAMGSCPIIFSDGLKIPEKAKPLLVHSSEDCVKLPKVSSYDATLYFQKFSNENLYQSIVDIIT